MRVLTLKKRAPSDTQLFNYSGALHDLVPFVKSKKHEKHPWRSVTFSNVAGSKLTIKTPVRRLIHGCFSHVLICTNVSLISVRKSNK